MSKNKNPLKGKPPKIIREGIDYVLYPELTEKQKHYPEIPRVMPLKILIWHPVDPSEDY